MSTPDNSDTPTIEQKITSIVDSAVEQDGKMVIPDEIKEKHSEAELYAAQAEMRRRHTQAEYSKNQQQLRATEAERDKIKEKWFKAHKPSISKEDQDRLKDLKDNDVEAWREEINKLEATQREELDEDYKSIQAESSTAAALAEREQILDEFNKANPDIIINDDVITNDLPPRLSKQLENGEISFSEFLDKAKSFLSKGTVVKPNGEQVPDMPDLSKVPGSSVPDDTSVEGDIMQSYKNETF